MSIQINSGANYTNLRDVTLTLVAPAGANQMRFSNETGAYGAWETFATTRSNYQLSANDGAKTVNVQFGAGGTQIGSTESANITLDTVAPTGVTIIINGGAASTSSRDVALTLTATDTASPVTSMALQNESGAWSDWMTAADNAWWTLSTGYGSKTVNVKFRDAAGNVSAVQSASISYVAPVYSVTGTWLILKTPDYDDQRAGTQTSYLRIGAADAATENGLLASNGGLSNASELQDSSGKTFPGWFEYTDGDRTEVTRGDNRITVGGNETVTIGGTKIDNISGKYRMNIGAGTLEVSNADPIYQIEFAPNTVDGHEVKAGGKPTWRKREWGHNSAESYTFGDTESFFAGYKFDAMFGLTNTAYVGGKIDLSVAVAVSASLGLSATLTKGLQFSWVDGKDLRVSKTHETKVRDSIHLRLKAAPSPMEWTPNKIAAALVAAAGGATVVGLAAGTKHGDISDKGYSSQVAGCLSAAAGVFAASLAASVFLAMSDQAANPTSKCELKMDSDGIRMKHNTLAGAELSALQLGDGLGNPRETELRNSRTASVKLNDAGDVIISTTHNIVMGLQNGQAYLAVRDNGEVYVQCENGAIFGRLTLGPANELVIG